MTDERLLSAAKLYEQVRGRLDGGDLLHGHAGLPVDRSTHSVLSFLDGLELDDGRHFGETELSRLVDSDLRTRTASKAVQKQHGETLAYLTGITERDLDASTLTLPVQILDRLDADGTLTSILAAGRPNTGKTNSVLLLRDLYRVYSDDLLCLSNIRTDEGTDELVRSMHDLMCKVIEHREKPKFVIVDEGSTHFDAGAFRREVREQWGPAVKRFSKVGVDVVAVIGHTGKDVHPEHKRLTNLGIFKTEKDEATFYEEWPADSDRPAGELFGGNLSTLEKVEGYDADDPAPWNWNLRPGLFSEEFDSWSEFLDELHRRGPLE